MDQHDRRVSLYGFRSNTRKWPIRVFDFLLQSGLQNCSQIYSQKAWDFFNVKTSTRDFLKLVSDLWLDSYFLKRYNDIREKHNFHGYTIEQRTTMRKNYESIAQWVSICRYMSVHIIQKPLCSESHSSIK